MKAIPLLTECVRDALQHVKHGLPNVPQHSFKSPLIVGSSTALDVGRMIFGPHIPYCSESTIDECITRGSFDGALIVSASGAKSAVNIIKKLASKNIKSILITSTQDSPASAYASSTTVFPALTEPYTYNVSTYLSMLYAATKENPEIAEQALSKIESTVDQSLANIDALFFVLKNEHALLKDTLITKCGELFGSRISARAYTDEDALHGRTLVLSPTELFIVTSHSPVSRGSTELIIELPEHADYATAFALYYALIGRIQALHPHYFTEGVAEYQQFAHAQFEHIKTI